MLPLIIALAIWLLLGADQADPTPQIFNLTDQRFPPAEITIGADGSAWMTELGGHRIARAALDGTVVFFSLPEPRSQLQGIARGADGNSWFTETETRDGSHNYVGRITPSGQIRTFPVPRDNAFLMGIVAGPDGNMWFTEFGAHRVGRITPLGITTEYTLPEERAAPQTIVVGPDKNLWTNGRHEVFRISTAGRISAFPVTSARSGLRNVAWSGGPVLWATEYDSTDLLRIEMNGKVTRFSQPEHRVGVIYLRPGRNGEALTIDMDNGAIATITAGGNIVDRYRLPFDYPANAVAQAPGGRLWFTVFATNSFGWIDP